MSHQFYIINHVEHDIYTFSNVFSAKTARATGRDPDFLTVDNPVNGQDNQDLLGISIVQKDITRIICPGFSI
jgi:hypothetical protein